MRPATGSIRLPAVARDRSSDQALPPVGPPICGSAGMVAALADLVLRGFDAFTLVMVLPRPGARLAGVAARAADTERDLVLRAAGFFAEVVFVVVFAVVFVFTVFVVFAMVVLSPLPRWRAEPSARTNHVRSPHRCFGRGG